MRQQTSKAQTERISTAVQMHLYNKLAGAHDAWWADWLMHKHADPDGTLCSPKHLANARASHPHDGHNPVALAAG
jgi:hypothetical protein